MKKRTTHREDSLTSMVLPQALLRNTKLTIKMMMRRTMSTLTPLTVTAILGNFVMTESNHLELKMIEEEETRVSLAF